GAPASHATMPTPRSTRRRAQTRGRDGSVVVVRLERRRGALSLAASTPGRGSWTGARHVAHVANGVGAPGSLPAPPSTGVTAPQAAPSPAPLLSAEIPPGVIRVGSRQGRARGDMSPRPKVELDRLKKIGGSSMTFEIIGTTGYACEGDSKSWLD